MPDSVEASFRPSPKHFRDRLYSADYTRHVMQEGRPGTTMVAYRGIEGRDLDDLTAYLNSLFATEQYDKEQK